MNKKVGILTLSASDNCGSLLQTYALKTYLEKYMGFYAEVINFKSEQSKRVYDIFPRNIGFHPRGLWLRLTHYRALAGQKKDYKHFREVYLKMKKKCLSYRGRTQGTGWKVFNNYMWQRPGLEREYVGF